MKTPRKAVAVQRQALDRRLKALKLLEISQKPRSGWMKAIRGALGMTARQLGARLGTTHQVILRQEEREPKGAVTLESMDRAARAMDCRFVYAILPNDDYGSLEDIIDERAKVVARKLAKEVGHSMKLENQGVDTDSTANQIERLAHELKIKLDPRLWEE